MVKPGGQWPPASPPFDVESADKRSKSRERIRKHSGPGRGAPPNRSLHKRRLIAALTTAALTATALTAAVPAHAAASGADPMAANPFGGNVTIFDSSWSNQNINTALRNAASAGTHWSTDRKAFFFKPGTYGNSSYNGATDDPTKIVNSEVGYYTQISGLGKNPAM